MSCQPYYQRLDRPTRPVDLDQPKSPAADSSKSPDIGRRLESAGVSLLFPALAFFFIRSNVALIATSSFDLLCSEPATLNQSSEIVRGG